MKIFVTQPDGKLYKTEHTIGVKDHESGYFRVMTEKWGKLFFYSKEDYDRWCKTGRQENERTNTLYVADQKDHLTVSCEGNSENDENYEEFSILNADEANENEEPLN